VALSYLSQPRSLIIPRRGLRKPSHPILDPTDPINSGLVACYLLGDTTVGLAKDISPAAQYASLIAGPVQTSSHHGGRSQNFNGTTQYASGPTSGSLNLGTSDATLIIWFKALNAPQTSYILSKRINSGTFAQYGIILGGLTTTGGGVSSKQITLFWYDGTGGSPLNALNIRTVGDVADGNWHHVVCTRRAGTNPIIYIDGIAVATTNVNGFTTNFNADTTAHFCIGAGDSAQLLFSGLCEGCRIYKRAISASEAARLYSEPYAGILEIAPRSRVGFTGGSTTVIFGQQNWLWIPTGINVNSKSQLNLSVGSWVWHSSGLGINAKSQLPLASKVWNWNTQGIATNGTTLVTLVNKLWSWGTQGVGVDSKTFVSLTTKVWNWTTQAVTIIQPSIVNLSTIAWSWFTKPISIAGQVKQKLMLLLGVGQ
jgi:hypothetical protein